MQLSPAPVSTANFPAAPLAAERPAAPAKSIVREHRLEIAAAVAILILGIALRLVPFFGVPDRLTEDEFLYITNVKMLETVGPYHYPALVQSYVHSQSGMAEVILPPTRCMFIMLGAAWDALFHVGPRMSLRCVAGMFSVFSFLLAGLFAYRLGGTRHGLTVGALMAVAPMELMMAHRELVDGVFAFWALLAVWLLWENLQRPGRLGWLAVYAGSITAMVLTKENAFFAAVGIGGILCVSALAPGLNLGKPTWSTLAATFAGGAAGVLVLICLAGSPGTLIETYRLLVSKAEKMDFAYQSGGGPWYRYIIDIMLVSPTVLLPAIGGIFALRRENRQGIYLLLFMVFSCAVMVNVRNGMNLRYATMWDMPLRFLAAGTLLRMAGGVRRAPVLAAVALVAIVGGADLYHYWLFFVRHDIGEPVTQYLMYATEIVRTGSQH
jgi:4-amino-4-deoxy-L-arabinose transferase-like glycosyltransferase